MASQVSDKTELKRTNFFPGLGWLLPRQLYEQVRSWTVSRRHALLVFPVHVRFECVTVCGNLVRSCQFEFLGGRVERKGGFVMASKAKSTPRVARCLKSHCPASTEEIPWREQLENGSLHGHTRNSRVKGEETFLLLTPLYSFPNYIKWIFDC